VHIDLQFKPCGRWIRTELFQAGGRDTGVLIISSLDLVHQSLDSLNRLGAASEDLCATKPSASLFKETSIPA
jgi:hypothetical protein